MRLLEHEGKRLLAKHGIPVPPGALWPAIESIPYPAVVKTQILNGGRGKRGGILHSTNADETRRHAELFLRGTDLLPPADAVLVEARLDIVRELYLAMSLDRSSQSSVLIAHAHGGVDAENVAREDVVRVKAHPLAGFPGFAGAQVGAHLGVDDADQRTELTRIIVALGRAFSDEDCELLEINPLVITRDGRFVAADARVEVDDAARFRHSEWAARRDGTPFERVCAAAGATGVSMEGDVAIVTSGAGLSMATLDSVARAGGSPLCVVDLGGTVFFGVDAMTTVFSAVLELRPRVLLVNAFFQLARCDLLSRGLVDAVGRSSTTARLVARIKGQAENEAAAMLSPIGVFVTDDMESAIAEAARR